MPHPRSDELCELADAGDATGVLSIVTLDEIAEAWCELVAQRMAHPDIDAPDEPSSEWWPQWFLFNCLHRAPHLHRELLIKLVASAPNDDVLGAIGAGPLEDWLYSSRDEIFWLDAEARKDPRFQLALDVMRY